MASFDLPPANLFDVLHEDRCRPAEVREYISVPPEDHDQNHDHVGAERRNTSITPHTGTLRLSTV